MDNNAIAGMVFTLLLALLIGGFVLLYPLSRRLGALLEARLEDRGSKPAPPVLSDAEVHALREAIANLGTEVDRLGERQEFLEKLLGQRTAAQLTQGEAHGSATAAAARSAIPAPPREGTSR